MVDTSSVPEFSKDRLLSLLETITQMTISNELSDADQLRVFERLTTSMKPDPYTIECLILGWVVKNYEMNQKT